MKKKLLLLGVVVCAFLMLGSVSVFAADLDASSDAVTCNAALSAYGNESSVGEVTLSEDWELSDEQVMRIGDELGVPDGFVGMSNQTWNSANDSVIDLEIYYGNTCVAAARVNRYTGSVIDVVQYYTPATFRMDDVVPGQWFYNSVKYVYDIGMMMGTDITYFSPNDPTTRAMLVTTLYRKFGWSNGLEPNPFSDVKSNEWYTDAVIWAAQNNIVNGYNDGRFGPNDPLTREQMAAIFYRFAAAAGVDVNVDGNIYKFADYGQISSWAIDSMSWACGVGLITGTGNNCLDPKGNATRAQMATILQRFLQ